MGLTPGELDNRSGPNANATDTSVPPAAAPRDRIRTASARIWRWVETHVVVTVLCLAVLAAILRFHAYTVAPAPADDPDEMAWVWAGQTLIEHGRPTSWTSLPGYSKVAFTKTQIGTVAIVTPWLDEPPVFALLEGGAVLIAGESTPQQANDVAARVPVIVLSLVSLLLSALLMLRLFGPGVALLATALLAASPAITEASRTVESEALLTPLLLGRLLICHHMRAANTAEWLWRRCSPSASSRLW